MKTREVERYRVPGEINGLLFKWGREIADSTRHLGYPSGSVPCQDYREQGYKEERPVYSREDFAKLCFIIDKLLNRPEQTILAYRYRHRIPARRAARQFRITEDQYLDYFERVARRVVALMDQRDLIEDLKVERFKKYIK